MSNSVVGRRSLLKGGLAASGATVAGCRRDRLRRRTGERCYRPVNSPAERRQSVMPIDLAQASCWTVGTTYRRTGSWVTTRPITRLRSGRLSPPWSPTAAGRSTSRRGCTGSHRLRRTTRPAEIRSINIPYLQLTPSQPMVSLEIVGATIPRGPAAEIATPPANTANER